MPLYALGALLLLMFAGIPAYADFSFVHITDTHFTDSETPVSNAAKNREMFAELNGLTPKPAFVVNTGDVCEIGTDAEYAVFRKTTRQLEIPMYSAPGNHDVRWNPRGKEGYTVGSQQPLYQSWDYENVHFVLLDSTVLLQHWGHFDQAQLDWLAKDLKKVGTKTPIIIGFHHWVGRDTVQVDNENALLRVLAPYNVRLFLIGHGHSDIRWNVNGAPAIMAKGLYQGSYHVVNVTADKLTVYRRTTESGKPDVEVLTEPLARPQRPRSAVNIVARGGLLSPGYGVVSVERGDLPLDSLITYRLNEGKGISLSSDTAGWTGTLDLSTTMPGFHHLNVSLAVPGGDTYLIPVDFEIEAPLTLRPTWRVSVGEVQGKLVADGSRVYVPTMGGDLVALDAKTGREQWRVKTGGSIFSTPLVAENTVYFGSADHYVYAADAKSGKVKWKAKTGGAVFAGAAKAGDIVCIGSTDTSIYGLDARNGKVLWVARGENMYQSQAATDGKRFFVGGWDNQFRCLDAKTGSELWKQPFGKHKESGKYLFYFAPAIASPTVASGRVFVSSNDGMLHAMEAETGKVLWEVPGPSLGYSSPLYIAGRLFNGSLTPEGKVFSFDALTGETIWEQKTGSVIYDSSCVFSSGRVFIGSVNGVFSAMDASDGQLLWQFRLPAGHLLASPAADNERVYIGSLSGEVLAFPAR
ncbi:MAG: PQQ-binding-like beta-propeller repeat protein [Armatimonadaceae bacterium]